MQDTTEEQKMVHRVLSGDREAFGNLIKQYERLVLHIVTPLVGTGADREDICQDVFVKVYQHLGSFRFNSKLGTWVGNIAYNTAVNFLKKRKNVSVGDLFMLDSESAFADMNSDVTAERIMVKQEELAALSSAIDQLPEVQKTVILLFYYEDASIADIRTMLEMSESAVKTHLFRARKALKEYLRN